MKKVQTSVLGIVGTMVFGILFIAFVVEGIDSLTASKELCFIENVSYPTRFPESSQEIIESGNFVNCRCGDGCVSDLGTCVKIITNRTSNSKMLNYKLPDINECTFTQTKCFGYNSNSNSNSNSSVEKSIEEAIEVAAPYVKMMNESKPVECWESNGDYFLENDKNDVIVRMIVIGVLLIISISLIVVSEYMIVN